MYLLYRYLRGLIRSLASQARPWQIAVGTLLGTLLGFLPIWPLAHGPSALGLCLLLLALIINCHLGSVLLFLGLGKLIGFALSGPAIALGDHYSTLAQHCADIPFLYLSFCSNTLFLGRTMLGLASAPLFAIIMYRVTIVFREKIIAKLAERRHVMIAGKVANQRWLIRIGCWFFGL